MACRFPGANDPNSFWTNLESGLDAISEIPASRWDWRENYGDSKRDAKKTNSRWGGFIDDIDSFDPLFFRLSPKEARSIDPQQRLALETAWQAIEDAGYDAAALSGRRVGVYVGVSKNDYAELMRAYDVPITSHISTGTVHSIIANRISYFLNLRGTSEVVDTACSSALVALHNAMRDLRSGECESALVGGVNALLSPTMYISHGQAGMLSSHGRCATFDHRADGYVRAEGVGFVLLKPLEAALRDRDHIVGVIKGSAVNHGGRANSLTSPNINAQAEVICAAHRDAGVEATSIDYIEAHGTGTPLGDPIEIEALKKAFVGSKGRCGIGSVKTNVGHLESASGMAGLFKVLLSLKHRRLAPQLHFDRLNPHIELSGSPFHLVTEGLDWSGEEPRRAGISAFGMGGVNAHVVVEEAPGIEDLEDSTRAQVIPLSARDEAALERRVQQLAEHLDTHELRLCDVAWTLQRGRQAMAHRAAFMAQSVDELHDLLREFLAGSVQSERHWRGKARGQQSTTLGADASNQELVARGWVEGARVDWDDGAGGRSIPLPVYPFERRRCWFDMPEEAPRTFEIDARDHFARDHVVDDRPILPGVAYLGVANALAGRSIESFEDLYWLTPLEVSTGATLRLRWEEGEGRHLSLVDDEGVHMKATVSSRPSAMPSPLNIASVEERCRVRVSASELYSRLRDYGLAYGPSFQVISEARIGEGEVISRLQCRVDPQGAKGLSPEPSMLDGLFQAVVASQLFGRESGVQEVPYHLEQATFFAPLTTQCIGHARETAQGTYDMDLYDTEGTPLAAFRGLSKRALRPQAEPRPQAASVEYYAANWAYQPLSMHRARPSGVLVIAWPEVDLEVLRAETGCREIVRVQPGSRYSRISEGVYEVDLRQRSSWAQLWAALDDDRWVVDTVVSWAPRSPQSVEAALADGVLSLLALVQASIRARAERGLRVLYVYGDDGSAEGCLQGMVGGLARTLAYENPKIELLTLGLDEGAEADAARLVSQEIAHHAYPPLGEVIYRRDVRRVRAVEASDLAPSASPSFSEGAYLVTGGAGGLGSAFAEHLARSTACTVVLVGRSSPNERSAKALATLEEAGAEGLYLQGDISRPEDTRRIFSEIDRRGLRLRGIIHSAGFIEDGFILTKEAASFLRVLEPKVQGLINLDAASRDQPLDFFVMCSSVAALMPNQGQCDYATGNSFMDAFSAHRNALRARGERRGRTISIAWPLWAKGGIRVSPREEEHLRTAFGMNPMSHAQGIETLDTLLSLDDPPDHCLAIAGDRMKIERSLAVARRWPVAAEEEDLETMLWGLVSSRDAEVDPESTFHDLGLDSLALVRLADTLNQRHGLALRPSVFFEHQSVAALATHLAEVGAATPCTLVRRALIDERLDESVYQKVLRNDEFFMRDHVVDGKYNVPGACFVEAGLQAFEAAHPGLVAHRLVNNYWVRKLSSGGAPIDMRISLQSRSEFVEYGVSDGSSGLVHAMGEIHGAASEVIESLSWDPLPIEEIRARMTHRREFDDLYEQIIGEGLEIGPSFMPMVEISLSGDEALAHLRLPECIEETMDDYVLHPTMLTGVLQTALLNNKPHGVGDSRYIPIAIDEVVLRRALPRECYVHSIAHEQNRTKADVRKFDALVATIDGEVVAEMKGVSLRCIADASIKPATSTPAPPSHQSPSVAGSPSLERVGALLIEICAEGIGLQAEEIEAEVGFEDFGIDSVVVVELNRRLERVFGSLSKTLLFEYRNFLELAGYFSRAHSAKLAELLGEEEAPTTGEATPLVPLVEVASDLPERAPEAQIEDDLIAIVGVAGRYPKAQNLDAFWQLLLEGRDCIEALPQERLYSSDIPAKWGSFIDDVDRFDALFFKIPPQQAELLDPQERIFLEVVWETLENGGYSPERLASISRKVGVFVGALWQPYVELGVQQSERGNEMGPSGLLYNIPNRVSYSFDWVGPSLAIDTACSSSLTALHYACMSLRARESDHAIAGGVNLSLTAGKYRFLGENGFLSSDGRCRSFGEGGDGYVPGEGVGAVLLKRLGDARRDGDRVLALIRSTAINHGGKTHGFTVPNPNQQAALIEEALAKAKVHPRRVSYVEAHGTGTSLGDPIEITGLGHAFAAQTLDRQFCRIGSLKSNIGHLEAAAGIAGLTKILLQLEHQTLVPSLHADPLNPNIDFEASPFEVQTLASKWSSDELPRIALLSSFGAGGSNGHAVIQEYEPPEESAGEGEGEGEATLDRIVPLSAKDGDALARMVSRLVDYLEELGPERRPSVAAVAHTLQRGRALFDHRAAFVAGDHDSLLRQLRAFEVEQTTSARKDVGLLFDEDLQQTTRSWVAKGKARELARLWSMGMDVDWSALRGKGRGTIVSLPSYPFARTRYWLPTPPSPLVARAPAELHPLLHRNISPLGRCVFESRFEGDAFFVGGHRIDERPVVPGVAQMGMVLAAADLALDGPALVLEDVVFVSPLGSTGSTVLATLELGADRRGATFEMRDETGLLCSSGRIVRGGLEAGPDDAMDLAALHRDEAAPRISADAFYDQLESMGMGFGPGMRGVSDLRVFGTGALARVELPASAAISVGLNPSLFDAIFQVTGWICARDEGELCIPFELGRVRCHGEIPAACFAYVVPRSEDLRGQPLRRFDAWILDPSGRVIVGIEDVVIRSAGLASRSSASSLTIATPTWTEAPWPESTRSRPPATLLFAGLDAPIGDGGQDRWIQLSISEGLPLDETLDQLSSELRQFLQPMLEGGGEARVVLALPSEHEELAAAASGMLRSITIEHPSFRAKVVRVSPASQPALEEYLIAEASEFGAVDIRVQGSTRLVKSWDHRSLPASHATWLRSDGVYWIAGGLGQLGRMLALHIARSVARARLVLSGRSILGQEHERFLDEIRATGASVSYWRCDLARADEVRDFAERIGREQGALHGIFHVAGIYEDSLFLSKTEQGFRRVLESKVRGTINLDAATRSEDLDFFVCFSSIAAAAGNLGQSDYAMANGFQDAFVERRRDQVAQGQRRGRSIAIAWPLWAEGGMQVPDLARLEEQMGIRPMPEDAGLHTLADIMVLDAPRVLVAYGDPERIREKLAADFVVVSNGVVARPIARPAELRGDLAKRLSGALRDTLVELTKIPTSAMALDTSMSDYGIESMMLARFANELGRTFGIHISPTMFFEHTSLNAAAAHLLETYPEQIVAHLEPLNPVEAGEPVLAADEATPPRPEGAPKHRMSAVDQSDDGAIAIVGMSAQLPGSPDLDAFWGNLLEGRDLITEIPQERWDWRDYGEDPEDGGVEARIQWGGFVEDIETFDAEFFRISPREASLMDPQHRKWLEVVWNCLEDAGIRPSDLAGSNTGIFVGVANHDYAVRLALSGADVHAQTATGNTFSVLANRISYLLDLRGPSEPVDTACSSSLVAIDRGVQSIRSGRCDAVIVGGVNALLCPTFNRAFSRAGMLSPDGRCKAFDQSANGYVRSEGFGAVLLKPLARAEANGDHIYGVIRGTSINHNGRVQSLTAPNPGAQSDLIVAAHQDAGVDPRAVGYIEAHGTGTTLGDPVEFDGLERAFSALYDQWGLEPCSEPRCGLGSVKSNIGHLESAAGIAGLLKVLLALKHRVLPPTLHLLNRNSYIDPEGTPFQFITEPTPWLAFGDLPRCAGVSSFGFGGVNAHVVVEEYRAPPTPRAEPGTQCIILSARSEAQLEARVARLVVALEGLELSDFARLAFTLQVGREAMEYRAAFVAANLQELSTQLQAFGSGSPAEGCFNGRSDASTSSLADDDLAALVARWTASAQLDRLAAAWVGGAAVDWAGVHRGSIPGRISLPGYPFSDQRFPLPELPRPTRRPEEGHEEQVGGEVAESMAIEVPPKVEEGELVEILRRHLAEITGVPIEQLDPNAELTRHGVDSIVITELSARLEPLLGGREPAIFFASRTIREAAEKLRRRFPERRLEPKRVASPDVKTTDVAIIGVSGRYPHADDILEFARVLAEGRDCVGPVPETHRSSEGQPRWGAFISDAMRFDYGHFNMSYRDALVAHPEERLLLQEAWRCFESAGYDPLQWVGRSGADIGVYVGASFHDYPHVVSEANQGKESALPHSSQIFTYANRLSYFFNLVGPSVAVDSACSSSLYAVFDAYNAIRFGLCELAIAGGVNLSLHRSKYDFLEDHNFLAKDGRCRAFAEGGSGYVPGEGVGLVLLKGLDRALEDRDNILAVIKGAAAGNDGRTHGFTVPSPDVQRDTILEALRVAKVDPGTLSCVECHGTGTMLGDPIEISALTEAFGRQPGAEAFCAISSVKSNIGHLEAAAGIAQLTKMVLQLQSETLFPNVMHHEHLNPNIGFESTPFRVQKELTPWSVESGEKVRRGGISSFGAGGTNVHLIVEQAPALPLPASDSGLSYIIPFSASSSEQLRAVVEATTNALGEALRGRGPMLGSSLCVRNIAATLQRGRAHGRHRLALVCGDSMQMLLARLQAYLEGRMSPEILRGEVSQARVGGSAAGESAGMGKAPLDLRETARSWSQGHLASFEPDPEATKVYLPGYVFKTDEVDPVVEQSAREPKSSAPKATLELVRDTLEEVMGALPEVYDDRMAFADLGIDSIMAARIHAALVRSFPKLDLFALFEFSDATQLGSHLDGLERVLSSESPAAEARAKDDVGDIGSLEFGEREIPIRRYIKAHRRWGKGAHRLRAKKVMVDGANIECLICGEGPTVVLLPPFNSTGIIWIRQINRLSRDFRLVVPHYPGLSNSDWVEGLESFDQLSDLMVGLVDALVEEGTLPTKRVHWVGWSLGGFLAQTISARHPRYVKKLVLVSTTTMSWSSSEYSISAEEFSLECAREFEQNYHKLPGFIRNMPEIQALRRQGHVERFVVGTTDRRVIACYFRMIARFRNVDAASRVRAKTLLISGADDVLMPARFARELSEKLPKSKYREIRGGRHFLSLFEAKTINERLREWLGA